MTLKYLNLTGLNALVSAIKTWVLSRIPTKTSELTNDANFITSNDLPTNHVTTDTTQTITSQKTWTAEQTFSLPIVGSITGTASKAIADEDGTSIKTGYVNVAGNQTVTGQKAFSANIHFTSGLYQRNTTYEIGTTPASNINITQFLADKDSKYTGCLRNAISTTGLTSVELEARNKVGSGALSPTGNATSSTFKVEVQPDGTKTLYFDGSIRNNALPYATNTYSLGSSSYQWSSVYAQSYYYNGTQWGLDKANVWSQNNRIQAFLEMQYLVSGGYSDIRWYDENNVNCCTFRQSTNYLTIGKKYTGKSSWYDGAQILITASGAVIFKGYDGANTQSAAFTYDSFYPEQNNAISLGTSTNQWASVYAQSYYYNGAAWGLDQANVWSKLQTFKGEYLGREYTINYCTCFGICGNNDTLSKSGMFFTRYRPNKTQGSLGSSDIVQYGVDVLENEVNTTNVFDIRVSGYDSNTGKFTKVDVISTSTDANLGTSTYKWKTINGCEPSALGGVYVANEVTIDTTNWVLDGSTWNTLNTSIMSGWVYLAVADCDADSFILFRRGNSSKQKNPTVGFHSNLANTGTYYLYGLFMVPKNTVCSILIRTGTNGVLSQALLYPCLGNV